jgi:hypothetical protein
LRSIVNGSSKSSLRVAAVGAHDLDGVVEHAHVPHRLDEEARVEQVHDGVLGAAGVGVDRQPVGGLLGVEGAVVEAAATGNGTSTTTNT